WLAADADARAPNDASLGAGVSCDAIGCIARLGDGTVVALPTAAEALIEDCAEAALVITSRTATPQCARALRGGGAGWEIVAARPAGEERPWSGRAGAGGGGVASGAGSAGEAGGA